MSSSRVLLLPALGAALLLAPVFAAEREVPPERGRLFIKDPEVFRNLRRTLLDRSASLQKRVDALGVFALTRERNVVPDIVKLATDDRQPGALRVSAVWALGEIGDPRGLPALQHAIARILVDDPAWRLEGIEMERDGKMEQVPLRDVVMDILGRLGEQVTQKFADLLAAPVNAGVTTADPGLETPEQGKLRAALVTLVAIGDRDLRAVRALCDLLRADDQYYPTDFKVIAADGLSSIARTRHEELAHLRGKDPLADDITRAFVEGAIVTDVYQVREIAGPTLEQIGRADQAARELVAVLDVPTIPKIVRYRAIETLAFLHPPSEEVREQVADELIFMLHHDDRNVRWRAAVSLGASGDKRAPDFLRGLLQDEDPFVRTKAIAALGHLESREALPDIVVAMADPDYRVRRQAALALGRLGNRTVIPALVGRGKVGTGLKDAHSAVRRNAVIALGYIGTASSLRHVADALSDTDPLVRLAAAQVLARFANPGATKALVRALGDPFDQVRKVVEQSLVQRIQARPEHTVKLLAAIVRDETGAARLAALRCLLKDMRMAAARKDDPRKKVYNGLLASEKSALTTALLASLEDADAAVRAEAAGFLVDHGWRQRNREILTRVAALANDLDLKVRAAAVRAKNYLNNLPR